MENNKSKLVNEILNSGVTQIELGKFLNVTRQTIKKLAEGYELTCKMPNYDLIREKDIESIKVLLKIKSLSDKLISAISDKPIDTLEKIKEGFEYLYHWCSEDKYEVNYIDFLFGHITNYHMRINPYTLLMRDFFHLERYPLVTININYDDKLVNNFYLKDLMVMMRIDMKNFLLMDI